MIANPTLPLPRLVRHPAWFIPLLLPVLPALSQWMQNAPQGQGQVELLILLLALGAGIAFGGSALVDHLGWAARKEVGLLRTPWIASLFLCQLPLLLGRDFEDLAGMLFFASAALLGAIPFGAEFQQRTLATLLSQPLPRRDWWTLKNGLLAAALGSHALLFVVSALATGHEVPVSHLAAVLAAALFVGSTTPAWNLRTRGLLGGLVLSVAVPLLTLFMVSTTLEVIDRFFGILGPFLANPWIPPALMGLGLTAYAVGIHNDGRRRWLRLEAPDTRDSESTTFLPSVWATTRHAAGAPVRRRPRPLLTALISKEFRLQSVALTTAFVTVLLALLTPLCQRLLVLDDYAARILALAAATTILLAGALPVAEQRRLGTLEAQALLPVSGPLQWWIMLGLTFVPTSVAVASVLLGLSDRVDLTDLPQVWCGALLFLILFASAVHASSTAANGVRALITAAGIASATGAMLGFSLLLMARMTEQASETWRERILRDPAQLRSEVRGMSPEETARLEETGQSNTIPPPAAVLVGTLGAGAAVPALLALMFARWNYLRPAGNPRRSVLQYATCLGLTGCVSFAVLVTGRNGAESVQRQLALARVHHSLLWEQTLTPAEHRLWERHRSGPDPFAKEALIRLGTNAAVRHVEVSLPLERAFRGFILAHGQIGEDLRLGLQEDEAKDTSPPNPRADRALLRAYGLIPIDPNELPSRPGASSSPRSCRPPRPRPDSHAATPHRAPPQSGSAPPPFSPAPP